MITAVDTDSTCRATFDAHSGVQLLDTVRASCAVPGVFPSVTIDGRRYADGGLRSPFNADLATGHGVVIVLSPLRTNAYIQQLLEADIASLGDARVHVIMADEASLAAIGPDLLSTGNGQCGCGRRQSAGRARRRRAQIHLVIGPATIGLSSAEAARVLTATQASSLTVPRTSQQRRAGPSRRICAQPSSSGWLWNREAEARRTWAFR